MEEKLKQKGKKEAKLLSEINSVISILKESPLKIGAKTGTSGKIFGSVTSLQISRAIRDQKGYEIDRKRISIVDEVKELGTYKASIDFGNGNNTELEFEVVFTDIIIEINTEITQVTKWKINGMKILVENIPPQ